MTAPELERELTAERTGHAQQIILDLAGLEFMDSAGLHAIERVCRHHRLRNRQVRLRGVPPQARRLFALARRAVEISA